MGALLVGLAMLGVFLTRRGPRWLNVFSRVVGALYCVGIVVLAPFMFFARVNEGVPYLVGEALALVLTVGALYYFARCYRVPKVRP
jgi:hypothetical protein